MERDIKLNWYFEQRPEQVWQCLTDVILLNQWFMQSDFKAEVGHQFRFVSKPMPAVGWDGIVYSEVLEVVPHQKLVYTWKGGPKPGVINLDTVLTWTLRPKQNGTLLTLEHKGFKGMKNFMSSFLMEKGWKVNIERKFMKVLSRYSHAQA